MIEVKEHIYHDNPDQGHPDCRTFLKDVSYFFLGNGQVQAAVQFAPSGEGTPVGLIFMNPEKLGAKREALSYDPQHGFANTQLRLRISGQDADIKPENITAEWLRESALPAVMVKWSSGAVQVTEKFSCPDHAKPQLYREILIRNLAERSIEFNLETGIKRKSISIQSSLTTKREKVFYISYLFHSEDYSIEIEPHQGTSPAKITLDYRKRSTAVSFHNDLLDRFFHASSVQLSAVVSASGKVDPDVTIPRFKTSVPVMDRADVRTGWEIHLPYVGEDIFIEAELPIS